MPRVIETEGPGACSVPEALAALDASGFDTRDEGSLANAAQWLARLGANRAFLGDLLVERLVADHRAEPIQSGYGPQAIVLSHARNGYFLRANVWPSREDHAFASSGAGTFAYDLPHDHNFDFLTVGYFGPGYLSDYYEYDYGSVAGLPGERADLCFVERSALSPGRLLHYRAHRDVHRQLPPESLSVSLNIVAADPASGWLDQYAFDLADNCVTGVLNPTSSEAFVRIAVGLGGAEAIDLAQRFGRTHPSDRLRLACYDARADHADPAKADAIWREAESCGSELVRRSACERRRALQVNAK